MPGLVLLYDSVADRVTPTVTSEAAGFDLVNLFDGARRTYWKATSSADQTILFDAGVGNELAIDYLALARADLLVAAGATLHLETSDDLAAWAPVFTPIALDDEDLLALAAEDYAAFFEGETPRAARVRLTGASAAVSLAGLWLGSKVALTRRGMRPLTLGVGRADSGLDWQAAIRLTNDDRRAVQAYARAVAPGWPGEQPIATASGIVYGTAPHFVYDDGGGTFGERGDPVLLNVQLMNPGLRFESVDYASELYETQLELRQVIA